MWKLEFQISGLPADDGERHQKRDNDTPRNAIWLVAGFVLAYLLGAGAPSGRGVAIISPTNGTATFDAQVVVSGTITGFQGSLVTVSVNGTTQTAPVTNGIFQSQINLAVGRNDIRASSGDIESGPITITRKARPILTITSPPAVSTTQADEVEVLGTVENLDGDSINLEVNDIPRNLPTGGGRFSTKVKVDVGTNKIRALAPGSDPAVAIVVRTETVRPAIVITSPESGFTTNGDSVKISGAIVNSDATEITLSRNDFAKKVRVAAGQFEDTMDLAVGPNEIKASLVDAVPHVVTVYRKLPPKIVIEIASDLPVSNTFAFRPSVANVRIIGRVENLDTQFVWVSLNHATRGQRPVRDGKFGDTLELKAGASYTFQAWWRDVFSKELVIDVPSARKPEPNGQGSPGTLEECATIDCDCAHVGLAGPGVAQPLLRDRIPIRVELALLRRQCLQKQDQLLAQCKQMHQWPEPCPREISGPNAWSAAPRKMCSALCKSDKGVKQP
jgi:hypothetical protein